MSRSAERRLELSLCLGCGLPLHSGDHSECFGEKHNLSPIEKLGKSKIVEYLSSVYDPYDMQVEDYDPVWADSEANKIFTQVSKISEDLKLPIDFTQNAVKQVILEKMKGHDNDYQVDQALDLADSLRKIFDISENDPAIVEAAESAFLDSIAKEKFYRAESVAEKWNFSNSFLNSPEGGETIQRVFLYSLSAGRVLDYNKFNLSDEFLDSPETQEAAKKGFKECIRLAYSASRDFENGVRIKNLGVLSEEFIEDTVKSAIVDPRRTTPKLIDAFGFSKDITEYHNFLRQYQRGLVETFSMTSIDNLLMFNQENNILIGFLEKNPDESFRVEKKDLPAIKKLYISLKEAEELKRADTNLVALESTKNFEEVHEKLKAYSEDWKDQNINKWFCDGAEIFGYEKMFIFLKGGNVNRHESLHAIEKIVDLQAVSGLSPDEFFNKILMQVKSDGATYEEGTSYHYLNTIASTLNTNFGEVIAKAQQHKDVDKLQTLASFFDSPEAIFSSWNNLKKYSELSQLLEQTQILEDLKELKKKGKDSLYHYIETLAFHSTSKVDMRAVIQFWRDPEAFLSRNDSHADYTVQDRKKPSNYVRIPNLDLTAEELRDSLIEGNMDALQVFRPLEIIYTNPEQPINNVDLRARVKKALGSFREKIKGEAKNPKKLFSEINKLFKSANITINDYLLGQELPEERTITDSIEALLNDEDIGLINDGHKVTFVAKINRKSDPDGVLAGDDTACCMPFGSGKNTVYTFNPDTSLFTIQIKKGDTMRTIAQSVLTKDKDIKTLIPDVMSQVNSTNTKLADILPEDVLVDDLSYLACDNVEVAPNYRGSHYIIETIYRDFFREYLQRFGEEQRLNPEQVVIGMGYSDSLTNLDTIPNTFAPLAPVSYSDKTHGRVYKLDLTTHPKRLKRKVQETEMATEKIPDPLPQITGLSYLTFEDTLSVAYLEGKAYSDNESLMVYLHNIENALIAKDINNRSKGRANMSLKYTDAKGKTRGYMLAYEGKVGNVELPQKYQEERVLYIADLAADSDNKLAGGKLIKGFVDLYRQNYLEKGNPIPIYAEAREQTSYAMIKKQLDRIGKDLGIDFELDEFPTYQAGDDIMHPIIIRCR